MYLSKGSPAILGLAALVSFGTLTYAGTVYRHGESSDHPGSARAQSNSLSGNGISYHGGPILLGTTNIHYIWYGNWTNNSATAILPAFATSIGGSSYFNINATYTNGAGTPVTNSCSLASQTNDNYSRGKNLSDNDVLAIVAAQNPTDTNGVYFVLTSADVNESSGFCTQYCAWHASASVNGHNIKLGFIGNPDRCPSACSVQSTSPNGNAGADAMASLIAHELEETVTDPNGNAWYDRRGQENADKCAWTFGQVYKISNGSYANMNLGGKDYLIQQNWVNASGGFCALSH
jgi:hypothetical protein